MELTIWERLFLLLTIKPPQRGNFITMRVVSDLLHDLGLSEEEIERNEVKTEDDGNATWKIIDPPKYIEVGPVAHKIISDSLRDVIESLNENESITLAHISLFDKFGIGLD